MNNVPFPQANNIELLFAVLNDIGMDGLTRIDVAAKYKIKDRQGSYYLDALLYLGFVEKVNTKYFLTQKGVNVRLSPKDKMKEKFIFELLEHSFIRELWNKYGYLSKEDRIIYISNKLIEKYSIANSTAKRRASSIISWFEWINKNINL